MELSARRIYFFGALGGLLFGYDTGVISGAILFIKEDFDLSSFMEGAVVASLLLGAMLGAGLAGPLSDRLGRRTLIIVGGRHLHGRRARRRPRTEPSACCSWARFVLGIAVGCAALVVPLYLSEIAPTEIRGAISSLNQLMIVGGILVAYLVNAVLASSEAWRVMLGLAVVPSLVLLVGMIWMPETPRFLVRKGEEDEAKEVLEATHADESPEKEIEEIHEVEREEEGGGLRELGAAWVRPALLVAIGLAVFQQLIGINTIIYYAPTTLTNVGYSDQSAIYANIAIGVLNVAMTVLAIRLVDRVGRKPLLLAGLAGMVTSLAVLGGSLSIMSEPNSPGDPAAIVTLVCLGDVHRVVRRDVGPGGLGDAPGDPAAQRARRGARRRDRACTGSRTSSCRRRSRWRSTPGGRARSSSATRSSASSPRRSS